MKHRSSRFLCTIVLCMVTILMFSGCSFSLEECSSNQIIDFTVGYLKSQGHSTMGTLDDFKIITSDLSQNKKEQTVSFSCSFLDDTVRYERFYEVLLKYDKQWKPVSFTEIKKEDWKDIPVAGVSMAQALDDVAGYHYESKFSDGVLDITKTNSACVVEQWEALDKKLSGIKIGFSLTSDGVVEDFTVSSDYTYIDKKGWTLLRQVVDIVPRIIEPISDDILLNAISMMEIEHEGEIYRFSDMKKTYFDVKNIEVDPLECEARVEMYVHGETELLYLGFLAHCDFRYSNGWYYYRVESYDSNISVGYVNDICLVTEARIKEDLSERDFKYGFAKDIPMKDLEIHDFEILSHTITDKGYRQEVSYTYSLKFDFATIRLRGNAVYVYEKNMLSRYTMNGDTTDANVFIQGRWYGVLPYDRFNRYVTLDLVPDESDSNIYVGIVDFVDLPRDPDENMSQDKEDSDLDLPEQTEAPTEPLPPFTKRYGRYSVKGICDTANYMKLQLVFVSWLEKNNIEDLIDWNGHFDCGRNEIVLEQFKEYPLTMQKPVDFEMIEQK